MEDSSTHHALTEVALALAMAFFAIMVLAMVSMTLPVNKSGQVASVNNNQAIAVDEATLNLQASGKRAAMADNAAAQAPYYLFYYNDHYYNRQLEPIALATLPAVGKVILALPPALALDKAMALQRKMNRADLVITQLNQQWLQRLAAL